MVQGIHVSCGPKVWEAELVSGRNLVRERGAFFNLEAGAAALFRSSFTPDTAPRSPLPAPRSHPDSEA